MSACVNAAARLLLFAASMAETRPSLSASSFVNAAEEVSIAATCVLLESVVVLVLVWSSANAAEATSAAAPIPRTNFLIIASPNSFSFECCRSPVCAYAPFINPA
jgi:hypothetical protein